MAISCCSWRSFRSYLRAFSDMLILGFSGLVSDLVFLFFFFSLFFSGLGCPYEEASRELDDFWLRIGCELGYWS